MHLLYSLLYLDHLVLALLSCMSVSLSLSLSSVLIHFLSALIPSIPHWHTRSFCGTSFSHSHPSSFSFLYSTQTVSCTLPFRPLCPRSLPLSFPLSLSAYSSCTLPLLGTLVFLCLLHPSQIFLLHTLHLLLFLPSPDLCSVHQLSTMPSHLYSFGSVFSIVFQLLV
jgi:hypothetical protein